jgi:hypothetical protein
MTTKASWREGPVLFHDLYGSCYELTQITNDGDLCDPSERRLRTTYSIGCNSCPKYFLLTTGKSSTAVVQPGTSLVAVIATD